MLKLLRLESRPTRKAAEIRSVLCNTAGLTCVSLAYGKAVRIITTR